ncbi:PREDICTED: insulin-like growth factor-binding protein complex acid labile subunit [Branchiostoma belcheri]|uniref:Insulin-like growth factor-binding protein complex acid labile subunit n=1 Tax=Branchiostoma belcheri TaxID=7741 RepID=A0A6P4ZKV5_BRABE|nr:PREDICTED: insulin-like growth factor-binding protein complex acid labile subunit [Branchiostoma belcheri]
MQLNSIKGTTMDCSHGVSTRFPRTFVSSTETLLMNDNQMTTVSLGSRLPNLLELSLEDNWITKLERSPFSLRPNLQILRLGGNKITNVVRDAFDGLDKLVKLYLNRNSIETVEAFAVIDSPSSLEILDLQRNKLTSIATSTFTGVPLLTELNLSSNNISTIEDGSFSGLKKLRVLYLHSNQIVRLTNETFMGLSSLKRLVLANNKIQNLPDMVFSDSTALEFLDLISNGISQITQKTFSGLFNLTALYMGRNNISTVEDGAFRDLVKLHTLSLFNNTLQDISASTFLGLAPDDRTDNTGLEELYLTRNRLTTVRKDDFARLTKLKILWLYGNNITSEGLDDGSFANLGNLVSLSLHDNLLTNFSTATFQGLPSLERLTLGTNLIQTFRPFAFANLPSLTSLDLRRNAFSSSSFHPDTFGNLTALQYLEIQGITGLPPRVFRHLPCLQTVLLGNDLICDCDILDLAKWLNRTAVDALRHGASSQPVACYIYNPRRRGVLLSNLREEDLQMTCPTTTDPPPTESTVQTCPTSLTTEVMTSPRLETTPTATTQLPPSPKTTTQPGTCTAPRDIAVQNVQESRAEITWFHDGKAANVDLTGFVIEYQIFGQKWKDTQNVHSDERYFTMADLVPSTPYQACVAVLCKGKKIQPGRDWTDCVHFTTKMRSTTIVGLAVGIPLLLVILCLVAAIVIVLKKRGPFSAEQDAGHTPERPQLQEANHSPADGAVGPVEDPPYHSIRDNPRERPDRENRYQNAGFAAEPVAHGITSSYLDLGQAGAVLNSAAGGPPGNRRFSESSFNNPVYTADSVNENIYTRVNDDGLDGTMARASSAEEDVYIDVIA